MPSHFALLAQITPASAVPTESFEFGRVQTPLDLILPLAVFVLLAIFAIWMYVRDCRELGGRRATLLSSLRLLALLGLLAIYLQPQFRARRDVVERSRVLLLADTSQSMQRRDAGGQSSSGGSSRSEAIIDELSSGTLTAQLRHTHDVVVYGFDEAEQPRLLATLPYQGDPKAANNAIPPAEVAAAVKQMLFRWRMWLSLAGVTALAGLVLIGAYLFRPTPSAWLVLSGAAAVLVAVGLGVWVVLTPPRPTLLMLLGISMEPPAADVAPGDPEKPEAQPDWRELLAARGSETRVGQAVQSLTVQSRSAPVAGMLVMTDGGQNAGVSVDDAAQSAREARITVYPIGLGSRLETVSARWTSFEAPERALPGDPFEIKARLRAVGLAGRSVTARLRQVTVPATADQPPAPDIALDIPQEVLVGGPQEELGLKFSVPGIKSPGRYTLELSLEGRGAATDPADARRRFQIEVVDRKTKVLLIAGGPGREYRFLRNLLRRDKRVDLDTWLQSSAIEKAKDDYPRVLTSFPDSKEKLYDYDCLIALDPDWTTLSDSQVALLASWVGDQAGGLIVVPGRVFAGSAVNNWLADPKLAKIRSLYPVEFPPVLFQSEDVGRKWTQARPIDLTRDGVEADFLRLADSPAESQRIWTSQFDGVYGTLPVKGAKTGAVVFARHIDPRAEAAGVDPVFLVEHFFGAGRVFYVGSGELWRLRQVDEGYFERFYTQLIDHVSKQRLQRGSRRGGILLLEKNEYHIGDNVPLAADLKNIRDEPLEVPQVVLYVQGPESKEPVAVKLARDVARKGMYVGQFVVRREGDYRLELPMTEGNDEALTKVIKVTTAARENDNPQRNDELLGRLARTTGGRYYIGLNAAMGRESEAPVTSLLKDRTQTTPLPGDIVLEWEAFWVRLAMFGVCGVLALEWLLRRLLRLA